MLTILNKRGIYAPVFLCDVCGKEITERDGMVKFSWERRSAVLLPQDYLRQSTG